MSESSRDSRSSNLTVWLAVVFAVVAVGLFVLRTLDQKSAETRLESERKEALAAQVLAREEIEALKKAITDREAEFAAQSRELFQREAAIAGREDAATERTQSSFQGLLIQQQLTRNLEALKASLPDMTPEVEKLAREHAQLGVERQRLEKENAELRRQLGRSPTSAGREL
jgi:predicted  nucleic acid-binding Zn-ribbon protein